MRDGTGGGGAMVYDGGRARCGIDELGRRAWEKVVREGERGMATDMGGYRVERVDVDYLVKMCCY